MKKLLCLLLCTVLVSGLSGCLFRAEETSEEAYETMREKETWEGRYFVVIRMWQGKRRTVTAADDYLRLDRHSRAYFYRGSTVTEGAWAVKNGMLAVVLDDGTETGVGFLEDGQIGLTMGDNFYILVKGKSRAEETIARLLGQASASSGPQGKEDLSEVPTRETPSVFSSLLVPTKNGTKPRTEPETTEEEKTTAPQTRPTAGSTAAPTQAETVRPTEPETAARPTETADPSWNEAQRLWNRGWYGFVTIGTGCTGVFSGAYRADEPCYGLSGRVSLGADGRGTYFFVDRNGALGSVGERLTGSCTGTASFLQILNGSAYGFSMKTGDAVMRYDAAEKVWRMELKYSGFMGRLNATVILRPWGETWEDTPYVSRMTDYSAYLGQKDMPGDPMWD